MSIRYGGVSKVYKCPCGKTFNVPYQSRGGGHTEWVYQRKIGRKKVYYCSYHCFKEKEEEKAL